MQYKGLYIGLYNSYTDPIFFFIYFTIIVLYSKLCYTTVTRQYKVNTFIGVCLWCMRMCLCICTSVCVGMYVYARGHTRISLLSEYMYIVL